MPGCELVRVFDTMLNRMLGLRVWRVAWILIQKMDVKSSFKNVEVDSDGVGRFAHRGSLCRFSSAVRMERELKVVGVGRGNDLRGLKKVDDGNGGGGSRDIGGKKN